MHRGAKGLLGMCGACDGALSYLILFPKRREVLQATALQKGQGWITQLPSCLRDPFEFRHSSLYVTTISIRLILESSSRVSSIGIGKERRSYQPSAKENKRKKERKKQINSKGTCPNDSCVKIIPMKTLPLCRRVTRGRCRLILCERCPVILL